MGVFSNQFIADIVGAEKLSWRSINEWLMGIGAIDRDALVPGALADGVAYAHAMNTIEPGLVRLSEKERRSPFLTYAALRQAMLRLNVHACGQNIAECIQWALATEWTPKDHLTFCWLLHALCARRALSDVGPEEGHVRLQDLVETDERNRLLRRRVDQLQLAQRALAEHCDSLHAELTSEKETSEHLHAILERAAIDGAEQLLSYADLLFAFAKVDVERAGAVPLEALSEALRELGIAPVPEAALASLRERPSPSGPRLVDFGAFARVASVAYVEHLRRQSEREETIAAIRLAFDAHDRDGRGLIDAADCALVLREAGLLADVGAVPPAAWPQGDTADLIAVVRLHDELVSRGISASRAPAGAPVEGRGRHEALRESFARYDHDRSGSITKLELAQAFRAAGMGYEPKTVLDVFEAADRDGSGTIDFAEFVHLADVLSGRAGAPASAPSAPAAASAVAARGAGPPPPRDSAQTAALRQAFAKYDTDGSGGITKLELAQAFSAAGMGYEPKTVLDVFEAADRDGSGAVDFAEFCALADTLAGRAPQRASAAPSAAPSAEPSSAAPSSPAPPSSALAHTPALAASAPAPPAQPTPAPAKPPPAADDAHTQGLRAAFRRYDADNSGSITRLELTNAFKAAGLQYDDKVIADTFDKADQNKDGSVDFGEFVGLADALANRS